MTDFGKLIQKAVDRYRQDFHIMDPIKARFYAFGTTVMIGFEEIDNPTVGLETAYWVTQHGSDEAEIQQLGAGIRTPERAPYTDLADNRPLSERIRAFLIHDWPGQGIFGVTLRGHIFESHTPESIAALRLTIRETLNYFLNKEIDVEDVEVAMEDETLRVAIHYVELCSGEHHCLKFSHKTDP